MIFDHLRVRCSSILLKRVSSVENHILPSVVPQIGGPNAVVVSTGGGWVVLLHHRLWTAVDGARGSEGEKLVLGGVTRPYKNHRKPYILSVGTLNGVQNRLLGEFSISGEDGDPILTPINVVWIVLTGCGTFRCGSSGKKWIFHDKWV